MITSRHFFLEKTPALFFGYVEDPKLKSYPKALPMIVSLHILPVPHTPFAKKTGHQ